MLETCFLFFIRNKHLKKYYRKLKRIKRFRYNRSTTINGDKEVAHDYLMVEPVDGREIDNDTQQMSTMNFLREPLLDDVD